jgi:UDP-glucuronate 4-epimerase
MPLTAADITKARTLLGYAPTTPIREGIPKFVAWYRALQSGKNSSMNQGGVRS